MVLIIFSSKYKLLRSLPHNHRCRELMSHGDIFFLPVAVWTGFVILSNCGSITVTVSTNVDSCPRGAAYVGLTVTIHTHNSLHVGFQFAKCPVETSQKFYHHPCSHQAWAFAFLLWFLLLPLLNVQFNLCFCLRKPMRTCNSEPTTFLLTQCHSPSWHGRIKWNNNNRWL